MVPLLVALPAVLAAEPLLAEDFASAAALRGWTLTDGAATGRGPRSEATVEDGALVLRVTEDDRRFRALTRTVEATGPGWLQVSFRQRTEAVDPTRATFDNDNVFVRVGDGALSASTPVDGTTDWQARSVLVKLPEGAHPVTVGVFLSMPGTAWFDDLRVEPYDPGWTVHTAENFTFHALPGDGVDEASRASTLAAWRRAAEWLSVPGDQPVDYFKYPDNATKARFTGQFGNAHVDGGAVHTIWPVDDHEIVHLLARAWGDPPALLAEGLAVGFSGRWQGQSVEAYARTVDQLHAWIPLSSLATTRGFRQAPDLFSYAEAGALVRWIEATHGHDALRAVYAAAAGDGVEAALTAVLGMDLRSADQAVRAWLATQAAGRGHVITGATAPTFALLGDSRVSLLVNPSTGGAAAALSRLHLATGAAVPLHRHPTSAEILAIESGAVEMTIGGQVFTARAGDAVYIPADTEHSARVTAGPVEAVQVYVGPGPEERFRAGAPVR